MADIFDNLAETLIDHCKTIDNFDKISSIECNIDKEEIRCGKGKSWIEDRRDWLSAIGYSYDYIKSEKERKREGDK